MSDVICVQENALTNENNPQQYLFSVSQQILLVQTLFS